MIKDVQSLGAKTLSVVRITVSSVTFDTILQNVCDLSKRHQKQLTINDALRMVTAYFLSSALPDRTNMYLESTLIRDQIGTAMRGQTTFILRLTHNDRSNLAKVGASITDITGQSAQQNNMVVFLLRSIQYMLEQ
jgi:hypothetical protein